MNAGANSRKNTARLERQQRKLDAGLVDAQFPEVADIVVKMIYRQRGVLKSLPRVVNFFPDSYAVFRIECLSKDCVNGGFDLTEVITGMIRNHKEAVKGELACEGSSLSSDHSTIAYEVDINYT